jgi:hypothetical protein
MPGAHRPADDPAREQIDHGRHVEPPLSRPDVGEVGDPFLVAASGRFWSLERLGVIAGLRQQKK